MYAPCVTLHARTHVLTRSRRAQQQSKSIATNLRAEAARASLLMIWTDCDREGEHIGSEIVDVCRAANRGIIVKRAKFSAIIAKWVLVRVDNGPALLCP